MKRSRVLTTDSSDGEDDWYEKLPLNANRIEKGYDSDPFSESASFAPYEISGNFMGRSDLKRSRIHSVSYENPNYNNGRCNASTRVNGKQQRNFDSYEIDSNSKSRSNKRASVASEEKREKLAVKKYQSLDFSSTRSRDIKKPSYSPLQFNSGTPEEIKLPEQFEFLSNIKATPKDLWVDKYCPKSSSDLALHQKKIQELRTWLNECQNEGHKLLVIVGPPGSGKSTMVRVLAQESEMELKEWLDTSSQHFVPYKRSEKSFNRKGTSENFLEYTSQLVQFEDFLMKSRYPSLSLASIHPIKVPQTSKPAKCLILIEDLPSVYESTDSNSKQTMLCQIFRDFIISTVNPVILILSDVQEKGGVWTVLEGILGGDVAHSNLVQVLSINPVTNTALKKALQTVAHKESKVVTGDLLEEIITDCGGDIRHALLTLQMRTVSCSGCKMHSFDQYPPKRRKNSQKNIMENGSALNGPNDRDHFFSHFHALGKLLYAKRASCDETNKDLGSNYFNMPLEFVPEQVLGQSGFSIEVATAFLQHHCVDFFSDINELESALSSYADADIYLSAQYDSLRNNTSTLYPLEYAACFASRAAAVSRRRPAPSKMRTFDSPPVLMLRQQCISNLSKVRLRLNEVQKETGALWAPTRHSDDDIHMLIVPMLRTSSGIFDTEIAINSYMKGHRRIFHSTDKNGTNPNGKIDFSSDFVEETIEEFREDFL